MPVISAVAPLSHLDLGTAGDYLRAAIAGRFELPDLVVVPVGADGAVPADAALDALLPVPAAEVARAVQLTGKAGQLTQTAVRAGESTVRVVLLGVGDRSASALRRAGGELGRLLRPGDRAVASVVTGQPDAQAGAFTEGVLLGSYRYSEKSAAASDQAKDAEVMLLVTVAGDEQGSRLAGAGTPGEATIEEAVTFATAVALARDLTNTPSVRKGPQWLADVASNVAAQDGLGIRVWTDDELASSGFGGLVAVGSGSDRPPRLIELRYVPPGAERHIVLVGKGITFDSGGLSLKPNDGMKAMKTDMAGGAAVIAAMSVMAKLGVADKVTGLVAAAENMPSGSAYRPGDVITHFGGRTTEVLNTDAEGRLVLAD